MPGQIVAEKIVVRFGENGATAEKLRETARRHRRHRMGRDGRDEYGVSVHVGHPGCTADEIAAFGEQPQGKYRFSTWGELRGKGFEFECEVDAYGHTNIYLPNPPTSADYVRLSECFTTREARQNPKPTPAPLRTPRP